MPRGKQDERQTLRSLAIRGEEHSPHGRQPFLYLMSPKGFTCTALARTVMTILSPRSI